MSRKPLRIPVLSYIAPNGLLDWSFGVCAVSLCGCEKSNHNTLFVINYILFLFFQGKTYAKMLRHRHDSFHGEHSLFKRGIRTGRYGRGCHRVPVYQWCACPTFPRPFQADVYDQHDGACWLATRGIWRSRYGSFARTFGVQGYPNFSRSAKSSSRSWCQFQRNDQCRPNQLL